MTARSNPAICAICCLALAGSAQAHSLEIGASGSEAKWDPARLNYLPLDRVPHPSLGTGHDGLEYVVVLPNRWAQTQVLHVCFVGGAPDLRKKIVSIAEIWIQHTNLSLAGGSENGPDCAAHDKSEIRIGFAEPGYWSYIGNDSLTQDLIDNSLVSMNFEGFDKNPPAEPRFTGIVLHEWGHALGLHHEHQSPASGCDSEYDWTKLYAYYQQNYGWDKKMVDNNVKQLMADRSAYDWSERDPQSIMIYGSNPKFLKKGAHSKCYFHDNNSLSNLDVTGIEKTYPAASAQVALKFQSATLPIVLGMKIPDNLRFALSRQQILVNKQLNLQKQ
ncbi:hypothetical protein [Mesorhizobium sp. WSM4884]|uniref:hypothetical protein n=1 Tax=Mesorhizobium sp. WSM4884 TaxID=3038542 RepID=UPI002417E5CB|nr:hypothetical protein [Mesorhizobium sp. WSM4884]MDG4882001.1 hypothetical protein [Mesorhizobium sp. WSM4884]